jgi:16S rRNA (cytosine1402-N4)-methyltransferase
VDQGHTPVLLEEVLTLLAPAVGQTYVDATAGLGGHAAGIAALLGRDGVVVLNDLDPGNLERAVAAVRASAGAEGPTLHAVRGSFAGLDAQLAASGLAADLLLADLGFSSNQVDDPARGLSFRHEGPLDMRLDPQGPMTAAELVNTLPEGELADVIYRFGEERGSRRVAAAIVGRRRERPFERTEDLAEVVRRAVPGGRRPGFDPATRTFQALRIAVNGEIDALEGLLAAIERAAQGARSGRVTWLRPGARVGIISFHSLEDRPVKRAMLAWEQAGLGERAVRKPVEAGPDEQMTNRRSRSAKLRVFRLGDSSSMLAAGQVSGTGP